VKNPLNIIDHGRMDD